MAGIFFSKNRIFLIFVLMYWKVAVTLIFEVPKSIQKIEVSLWSPWDAVPTERWARKHFHTCERMDWSNAQLHAQTRIMCTRICQPRRPYVSFWLISATHTIFLLVFCNFVKSTSAYTHASVCTLWPDECVKKIRTKNSTEHTINGMAWYGMNANAVKVKTALA